jgi:hypothetical protein
MDYAIKQHEEHRADVAARGVVEEGEDLVDTLLRVRREGGLEVPLTMGMVKAVILVSSFSVSTFNVLLQNTCPSLCYILTIEFLQNNLKSML